MSEKGTNICNGLIHDWVRWQRTTGDSSFKELTVALDALSPSGIEKLSPGNLVILDLWMRPNTRHCECLMALTSRWFMLLQVCVELLHWPT